MPLTIAAFTLPLPYLEPTVLSDGFMVGTALLMFGLAAYNGPALVHQPSAAGSGASGSVAGGSGAGAQEDSGEQPRAKLS